ncbi:MAG: FAD-dependent oxidoreductase [Syntrophales bacterium]|nr:FAD-dependent oxidoreductase [Syntrophales bacterium]
MGKHLVFVGGGHAHLLSLKNLAHFKSLGHRVTLVSSSPYHYYSGMGPGMLSGIYHPREARFHVKKLAEDRGAAFIEGKAVKVDPAERLIFLGSGETVHYDVASFNTGSDVPVERLVTKPEDNLFPVKPVLHLLKARHVILKAIEESRSVRFAVVGGGPAGVEISANILRLLKDNRGKGEITLVAAKKLLDGAPDKARVLAVESLARRGVRIIEGAQVKAVERQKVLLNDGEEIAMDIAFIAIGIRPSPLFRDSGIPTGPDGGMLVNSHLQSVAYPELFGGGDCISLEGRPLAKVGVYAVRENPILYHNLTVALEGGTMTVFTPQSHYLLIFNMGNGKGIYWKKGWVWEGRSAFLLKDYIDRKFMREFQLSGELDELSDIGMEGE